MPEGFSDDVNHSAAPTTTGVPEWATVELSAYVTSDSQDVNTRVSLKGCMVFDKVDWDGLAKAVVNTINDMLGCDDARTMTRDEVKEYLAAEAAEEEKNSTKLSDLVDGDDEAGC